ncbi:MAG TPA: asparaginase [Actinospica sp.]|nr:asparaginase [Actinospica sp.]
MTSRDPARVAVFSLGGTIAMTTQPDGTVAPALSAEELLEAVPQLAGLGLDLEVQSFRQLPGASLSYTDLFALADAIDEAIDAGAAGVVVTQGTDTIEETAYFLDLVHSGHAPVVVTGAMRNPTMAGADGPANILAAMQVAVSPATPKRSLVVFADEVHAAAAVSKTHSTSVTAFVSTPGPIGYVAEGEPAFHTSPAPTPRLLDPNPRDVRTALITATVGDDGSLLPVIGEQVDGLVVAGFGAGHVPATYVDELQRLASTIPVILATRTGRGPVLRRTYGFRGSESDLISRGLIPAGTLTPVKAKVLLHTALALGATSADIRKLFEEGQSNESR